MTQPATKSEAPELSSALYSGTLKHRRLSPRENKFSYPVFMAFIDLDEIEDVFKLSRWASFEKFNLLSFYRRDYFKNSESNIKKDVQDLIFDRTGERLTGPVRMLTHLRTLGFCFNPITVYYCYDSQKDLKHLVLDVTNTPWGQRHQYVMPYSHSKEVIFDKSFHVSPFLPMDLHYKIRITNPGVTAVVHMENHNSEKMVFDATLTISKTVLTAQQISKAAFKYVLMTHKVLFWIYFQAFILFFVKKIKFVPHPGKG